MQRLSDAYHLGVVAPPLSIKAPPLQNGKTQVWRITKSLEDMSFEPISMYVWYGISLRSMLWADPSEKYRSIYFLESQSKTPVIFVECVKF